MTSDFAVLLHETSLLLLITVETYFVHLPLNYVELFVVVVHTYEVSNSRLVVLDFFLLAHVAIWEVRPAAL